MVAPTDFNSYVMGVELTNANYDATNQRFPCLVRPNHFWTKVGSANPVFETRATREGINFSGNQHYETPMCALGDCTIVTIAQIGAGTQYLAGGLDPANFSFIHYHLSGQFRTFVNAASTVIVTAGADARVNTTPSLFASAWSPKHANTHVQVNDGTLVTGAQAVADNCGIRWTTLGLGAQRTSISNDVWITAQYVFSRSLPDEEPAQFQQLMTDLMATVGL